LLVNETGIVALQVSQLCRSDLTDNELSALVSLAFNIGGEAFAKSTVLKLHTAGNKVAAAKAFGLWVKSHVDGKLVTLSGLVSRRAEEAALYLEPETPAVTPPPQEVAPEKPLSASTIVRGSSLAGLTAAIAAVNEVAQQAQALRSTLGGWVTPAALAVVALAAAYVVYQRFQQRARGEA
jgi:lysozyme